jgi:fumarate hydratase class II
LRFPSRLIRVLALLKAEAASALVELGELDRALGEAIRNAALEVARGDWQSQFPLDVFQTGSATSLHMNVNEVIANRAIERLGGVIGSKHPVHPNDHVNRGQSSNDVIPTAIHVAAALVLREELLPALRRLEEELGTCARRWWSVIKLGRTHLQDAVPIRMGQVFAGYQAQIAAARKGLEGVGEELLEVPFGGTAVGTGFQAPPGFAEAVLSKLSQATGLSLRPAQSRVAGIAAKDAVVGTSGALVRVAVALSKVANDLRWLASGPRSGLGELILPALQPGSSIMPGKVNPVVPEVVLQVAAQVIGNHTAVTLGGLNGALELNTAMPLLANSLLRSMEWLARAVDLLVAKCLVGLEVDERRCREHVERSLALVTALVPVLGYDLASELAFEAHRTGRTLRAVCLERGVLPPEVLDQLLNPEAMVGSEEPESA